MSFNVPIASLKSLCLLVADCPHSTPLWTDYGVVVLRNQNIKKGRLDLSSPSFTDEKHYQSRVKRAKPQQGDLVITREAPMGDVCQIPADLKCCLGQRQVLLRPDPTKVDSGYLLYALQAPFLQQQIGWNEGTGSTVSNLRIPVLEGLSVPTPPIHIQKKISSTLSALDDRISLLRETNKTLEAIAQAIFKSWFVDFDPVRAKMEGRQPEGMDEATAALFPDSFEESELGLVPKGWLLGNLENLCTLNPESWTAKNRPQKIHYVDLANTKSNTFSDVIELPFNAAPSRARRVLRKGDTIIGTVRPGNKSYAYISADIENLTGSTGFAVLRPRAEISSQFIYLASTQDSSIEYLTHIADGGAYPAVKPEVISAIPCVLAEKDILTSFHTTTAPLFASISNNQSLVETLTDIRDTLLPRLISGQLRLPDAQEQIESALT